MNTCKKCGSNNINITLIAKTKKKGKGCAYWLFIGWWLEPCLWLFLTIPMLIFAVFGVGKRTQTVTEKNYICQNCGNVWQE